jgi:hypothetical protein
MSQAEVAAIAYPEATEGSKNIMGWQNMRHPCIQALIDMVYTNEGLGRIALDKELVKTIKQDWDRGPKIQALKLAYELQGELKNTLDITVTPGIDYARYTDEQLIQLKQLLEIGRRPEDSGADGGDLPQEPI